MKTERCFANDLLHYDISENDDEEMTFAPHCHDWYEVYCFLGGRVEFRVEGSVYRPNPGDVLLLDRTRFHSAQTFIGQAGGYRRAVMSFSAELLRPDEQLLLAPFRVNAVRCPNAWEKGLKEAFEILEQAAQAPAAVRDIAIRAQAVTILAQLFAISQGAVGPQSTHAQTEQVLAYINANLTQPLTLEGLAGQFYLSRNSLARSFKRATGTTVGEYILYKRMALARILLRSGHPAGVVARECGFADYSTFYRSYCKVFGQSPAAPIVPEESPRLTALAPTPEAR